MQSRDSEGSEEIRGAVGGGFFILHLNRPRALKRAHLPGFGMGWGDSNDAFPTLSHSTTSLEDGRGDRYTYDA